MTGAAGHAMRFEARPRTASASIRFKPSLHRDGALDRTKPGETSTSLGVPRFFRRWRSDAPRFHTAHRYPDAAHPDWLLPSRGSRCLRPAAPRFGRLSRSSRASSGVLLDREDPFGRARQRVPAQDASEWCRRGWPRLQRSPSSRLWPAMPRRSPAAGRGDRARGPAQCETPSTRRCHRSSRASGNPVGSRPKSRMARRPLSRGIASCEQIAIQPANQRAAAEKRQAEAHALFFREADDLDVEAQSSRPRLKATPSPRPGCHRMRRHAGRYPGATDDQRGGHWMARGAGSRRLPAASMRTACRLVPSSFHQRVNIPHRRRKERARDPSRFFGERAMRAAAVDYCAARSITIPCTCCSRTDASSRGT